MTQEIWQGIEGFSTYEVSSSGRVRNSVTRYVLAPLVTRYGYARVALCSKNTKTYRFIHRLVASAFLPNPEMKPAVNHKNGGKTDNQVTNLEWVTHSENQEHSRDTGLSTVGQDRYNAKLTDADVRDIRNAKDTISALATRYGVSRTNIWNVRQHISWKHVTA